MAPIISTRDVLVQVENLAAAAHFYESVLGLAPVRHSETLVGFETGAFCLYLEKGPAYGPVFEFLVPDLADARRRFIAAGCRIENDDPTVPRCYLRDPQGLVFNVAERKV